MVFLRIKKTAADANELKLSVYTVQTIKAVILSRTRTHERNVIVDLNRAPSTMECFSLSLFPDAGLFNSNEGKKSVMKEGKQRVKAHDLQPKRYKSELSKHNQSHFLCVAYHWLTRKFRLILHIFGLPIEPKRRTDGRDEGMKGIPKGASTKTLLSATVFYRPSEENWKENFPRIVFE